MLCIGYVQSGSDEGSASAERTPRLRGAYHRAALRRRPVGEATLSHKGTRLRDDLIGKADVLFRVNRVTLTVRRLLPVFPDKRTFPEPLGMSQRCQQPKSLPSFDHLVGEHLH
jgi:hypothetical protein